MSRAAGRLGRRLMPLHGATFVGGIVLWYPVEKLFLSGIGFDPALVGVLAAAYAAAVPVLEVPTGLLADRWSRRGVFAVGLAGLAASTLVGALSHSVGTYVLSALLFSVYLACSSGTTDSIVYDTVLEETGSGADYPRQAGRLKLVSSLALLVGSLGGGWLASVTSPRVTYAATLPLLVVAGVLALRVVEPRLHRTGERTTVREQARAVRTALLGRATLLPAVGCLVLGGTAMAVLWEFNQLWLVLADAPLQAYGPLMAALFLADGLGGLVAGRLPLRSIRVRGAVGAVLVAGTVLLTLEPALVVAVAVMPILMGTVSWLAIGVSGALHDAVPSSVRAGVVSGVSSLTWVTFTPVALAFGAMADGAGVGAASWLLAGLAGLAAATLVLLRLPTPSSTVHSRAGASSGPEVVATTLAR